MLYMKRNGDVVEGMPLPRPLRVDATIGNAFYRDTDCTGWTEQQLEDYAGWIPVDPAAGFDGTVHEATGGGTVSASGKAVPAYSVRPLSRAHIMAEAERRIDVGILVDGKPFKADNGSVSRISSLSYGLSNSMASSITFKTAAGDTFTLTTATQADTIYDALISYQSDVLTASATLQDSLPADYLTSAEWPAQASVTLPAA